MLVLTYKDASGAEVVVSLESGTVVTVGRNPGSTIRVRNPSVSRNHARILEKGDCWLVEDLGSSNHSYLNDEKVQSGEIKPGDVLRFGNCPVSVVDQTEPPEPPASKPKAAAKKAKAPKKPKKTPEVEETERKKELEEERERRRQAREARRAKRQGGKTGDSPEEPTPKDESREEAEAEVSEDAAPPASKRTRPKRETPEAPPAPAADEVVKAPAKRSRPTREVAKDESATEPEEVVTEPEEADEASGAEVAEEEEASSPRRPASKPTRDNEMRQRRRGRGDRKVAAEARQESVASKRSDPGFAKDLREAESRAGEMELALHKAESRVEELEARLHEVETRDARHEEELDGWHERYNRVREQLAHQGELLERSKETLAERDQEFADAEGRVTQLAGELAALEGGRSEVTEQMSELKARTVQKDRRIDELQRELDLMEFDLREAREEIESLIDDRNVDTGEQRRVAREMELLREVNAEKENVVTELKLELEQRSRELYDAKLGSGIKDLEEARRDVLEQFFEKNREVDELNEKLKTAARENQEARGEIDELEERLVARRDLSSHPDFQRKQRELERAQADVDDAQETIARLEMRLEEFGPEAKSKMDAEVNFLERKNKALQEKVASLQKTVDEGAPPPAPPEPPAEPPADLTDLRASADEHLSGTLDDYADWKSNLSLLKTYIEEAREAIDEEGDVDGAFDSIEELLKVVSSEANAFRRQLVGLKDLFDDA